MPLILNCGCRIDYESNGQMPFMKAPCPDHAGIETRRQRLARTILPELLSKMVPLAAVDEAWRIADLMIEREKR
jgi:hypothetical protein